MRLLTRNQAALLTSFGAVLISAAPILVGLLETYRIGPSAVGAWRLLIASAAFWALGGLLWPARLRLRGRAMPALVSGVLFALDLGVWHRSILLAGAGMATILGNTQVFWTSVAGRALFGDRLTWLFRLAAAIAFVGIGLLVGVGSAEVTFGASYLRGVGWGLLTGVVYASYLISLKRATDGVAQAQTVYALLGEGVGLLAWITLVAGLLLFGAAWLGGEVLVPSEPWGWLYLVALAIVVQVVGWASIYVSLGQQPASRSALLLLIQPVMATLLGAAILGETLTWLQGVGAVLAIAAIYLGGMGAPRQRKSGDKGGTTATTDRCA